MWLLDHKQDFACAAALVQNNQQYSCSSVHRCNLYALLVLCSNRLTDMSRATV